MSLPEKSSHNRIWLLVGGSILLILTLPFLLSFLLAFSQQTPTDPEVVPTNSTKPPAKPANLEVLSTSGKPGASPWSITGKIRNNTAHSYNTVQVSVRLYDQNGRPIGSTMTLGKNVQAGKVWDFTIPVSIKNVHRYEVVDVLGM